MNIYRHICPPSESAHLYHKAGLLDMFHPDYEKYPDTLKASCYEFITHPGDFVYYPKNYWHQTLNLETPTIAFTGTVVTPHNHESVADRLENECLGKGSIFVPEKNFCRQMRSCYELWKEYFQKDFSNNIDRYHHEEM